MNEQQQAEALARWIDAGGHTDPPEGVDPDVLEAVLALRPDLAPAPRVSVDDILADLAEGPFAADPPAPGGEVVPFPVPSSLPPRGTDLVEEVPTPANDVSWRRGMLGGVAGLLAAAAAMVLVLDSQFAPVPAALDKAQVLDRGTSRGPAPPAAAKSEAAQEAKAMPRSGRAYPEAREGLDEVAANEPPAAAPAASTRSQAPVEPPAKEQVAKKAVAKQDVLGQDQLAQEQGMTHGGSIANTAGPIAEVDGDAVADLFDAELDAALDDDAEEEKAQAQYAPAADEAAGAAGLIDRKTAAKGAPRRREVEEPAAYRQEAPAEAEPEAGTSADAAEPDTIEVVLDAARTRAASGDLAGAIAMLEPRIAMPAADGQRAAEAAARHALALGDPSRAITLAARGLSLSKVDTPTRRALTRVLADAQQAQAAPTQTAEPADGE